MAGGVRASLGQADCGVFRFSEDALGEPRWCGYSRRDALWANVHIAVHLGSHFAWRMEMGSEASLRDERDGWMYRVCTYRLLARVGVRPSPRVHQRRRERNALLRI